jgi:hypothetical protein
MLNTNIPHFLKKSRNEKSPSKVNIRGYQLSIMQMFEVGKMREIEMNHRKRYECDDFFFVERIYDFLYY